jgi:CubicO group peptidase (beta-lactamase class C family)
VPDAQECEEIYAVGHTGVTGTSLWIEPQTGAWVVLLTNRVYEPRAEIQMQEFRRELFEEITGMNSPARRLSDAREDGREVARGAPPPHGSRTPPRRAAD